MISRRKGVLAALAGLFGLTARQARAVPESVWLLRRETDENGNEHWGCDFDHCVPESARVGVIGEAKGRLFAQGIDCCWREVLSPRLCNPGQVQVVGDGEWAGRWLMQGMDCEWYEFDICTNLSTICPA